MGQNVMNHNVYFVTLFMQKMMKQFNLGVIKIIYFIENALKNLYNSVYNQEENLNVLFVKEIFNFMIDNLIIKF